VWIQLIRFPVPEGTLIAIVDLHPLHTVSLEMLRDERRVTQLLCLCRLDTRIEPRAPAVQDRLELHVVQSPTQRGVLLKPREGIGSE
jgi:hypothetical protein